MGKITYLERIFSKKNHLIVIFELFSNDLAINRGPGFRARFVLEIEAV